MLGNAPSRDIDPALALAFLHGKVSDRKMRLFACACCRLVWPLLTGRPGRARVEAVEHQLDGETALPPGRSSDLPGPRRGQAPAFYAEIASVFAEADEAFAAALVASAMVERADPVRAGRAAQAALLADLFGRPSLRFNPLWRTPEIESLAQSVYAVRRYQTLPRLADLLEQAGCLDRRLLDHLRSDDVHTRGCWALDLVLGKS